MGALKRALRILASKAGLSVNPRGTYDQDGLYTRHSDAFRRQPRFAAAHARAQRTVAQPAVQEWREHILHWCGSVASRLPGDFVECGVFVGFMSTSLMKYLDWDKTGKTFYLIDTFKGPDTGQFSEEEIRRGRARNVEHVRKIGGYDYDLENVRKNFSEWKNVRLLPGLVPEVLANCPAEKVAYLHLDMNAALPEAAALRFFWDKLVPGGVVLMDDYAYVGYEEQQVALDAVARAFGVEIASLPTGQGILIKPPA